MNLAAPLFGLGFATTVVFWPGLINAAVAPRWALLAVAVPALLFLVRHQSSPLGWPALILGCAGITLAWTPDLLYGIDTLVKLSILLGAFYLGTQLLDARAIWRGLQFGVAAIAALVVAQYFFDYQGIPQAAAPGGLFMNKNMMGEVALVSAATALAMNAWFMLAASIVVITLTTSKAVWGACAVVLSLWVMRRDRGAGLTLMVATALAFAASFLLGLDSAEARYFLWQTALDELKLFGNGLGAFNALHPRMEFVHSEPLQLVHELGVFSIPFFALFVYALRSATDEPEYLLLAALATVSFFSFPFHLPLTAFAAALAAGLLVGRRFRVRVHVADRRMALGIGA